jgi:hypothetical protein
MLNFALLLVLVVEILKAECVKSNALRIRTKNSLNF